MKQDGIACDGDRCHGWHMDARTTVIKSYLETPSVPTTGSDVPSFSSSIGLLRCSSTFCYKSALSEGP